VGARRTRPEEARTREWLAFHWGVPSEGYEWIDGNRPGSREGGPWLVARGQAENSYSPWKDSQRSALFRDLADVTDRHTALAFANRYGDLGVREGILPGTATTGQLVMAESLARWVFEAAQLRVAVQVMDAARQKDRARLLRWIRVDARGALFSHPDAKQRVRVRKDEQVFRLLGPKRPGLGLLFAQRLVNARLEKDTTTRVLADTDARGELVLGIAPRHLLAAAWVQLAQSLTGESTVEYRRCLGCPRWLAIGPGVGRRDREYCGDNTCRQRVKRARRKARRET
jgi:hypothetical protein